MPETKPKRKATSYDVLTMARRLIDDEVLTLKELSDRVDIPPTSLSAMLRPGYENISVSRVDRIKDAVRKIREEMDD